MQKNKKSRLISENAIRAEVSSTPSFRFRKEPNDLTDEDFAKITDIYLQSAADLKDAKDIFAGNARPHYLEYDRPSDGWAIIYDLEFIGKLTNLERLYLRNLPFYNVNVPRWKEFLYEYRIYDPYKKKPLDLSPLKQLKNLKYLNIYNTTIKSLLPLAEIESLEGLSISATPIHNKKQLLKLQNIKNLLLLDVEFRDITPHVPVSDLTLLKQFPDLEKVWIPGHGSISGEQISELKKAVPGIIVIDYYMIFTEDFGTYIN